MLVQTAIFIAVYLSATLNSISASSARPFTTLPYTTHRSCINNATRIIASTMMPLDPYITKIARYNPNRLAVSFAELVCAVQAGKKINTDSYAELAHYISTVQRDNTNPVAVLLRLSELLDFWPYCNNKGLLVGLRDERTCLKCGLKATTDERRQLLLSVPHKLDSIASMFDPNVNKTWRYCSCEKNALPELRKKTLLVTTEFVRTGPFLYITLPMDNVPSASKLPRISPALKVNKQAYELAAVLLKRHSLDFKLDHVEPFASLLIEKDDSKSAVLADSSAQQVLKRPDSEAFYNAFAPLLAVYRRATQSTYEKNMAVSLSPDQQHTWIFPICWGHGYVRPFMHLLAHVLPVIAARNCALTRALGKMQDSKSSALGDEERADVYRHLAAGGLYEKIYQRSRLEPYQIFNYMLHMLSEVDRKMAGTSWSVLEQCECSWCSSLAFYSTEEHAVAVNSDLEKNNLSTHILNASDASEIRIYCPTCRNKTAHRLVHRIAQSLPARLLVLQASSQSTSNLIEPRGKFQQPQLSPEISVDDVKYGKLVAIIDANTSDHPSDDVYKVWLKQPGAEVWMAISERTISWSNSANRPDNFDGTRLLFYQK